MYVSLRTCPVQAERRLVEEVERVANYLDPSTEAKLTRVAEQELIQNQVRPTHGFFFGTVAS